MMQFVAICTVFFTVYIFPLEKIRSWFLLEKYGRIYAKKKKIIEFKGKYVHKSCMIHISFYIDSFSYTSFQYGFI